MITQQPGHRVTEPADPAVVLHRDHQPVAPRRPDQRLVDRLVQRGSTTVTPIPCTASRSATSRAISAIGPAADEQHVRAEAGRGLAQHVHAAELGDRLHLPAHLALGEPDHGRPVGDLDRLVEQFGDPLGVPGRGDPHAGTSCMSDPSHIP